MHVAPVTGKFASAYHQRVGFGEFGTLLVEQADAQDPRFFDAQVVDDARAFLRAIADRGGQTLDRQA